MTRQEFWQTLAPGARKNFIEFDALNYRGNYYSKFLNVETSDKAYEDAIHFAGLPPMPEKTENSPVAYFDLIQGGTKRYVNLTYGMGVRYSLELSQDDLYGVIKKSPEAITRAYSFTKEMTAANVLNLGFTSTTTDDGVSLFNNQHPLLGGVAATNILPGASNVISAAGTYPNRPSVDADLSFTALQLMITQFERMPDARGLPVSVRAKTLVIPPELQFIAKELLGSSGQPYTADNQINSLLDLDLGYTINNYLTSASAWFVVADKSQHRMRMFERQAMEQEMDDDFDTLAIKHIGFGRFSVGADTWIGTWGSNGP